MNSSSAFLYHQWFFVLAVLLVTMFGGVSFLQLQTTQVIGAIILFFGLGIPHGALDLSLGRLLFEKKCKSFWLGAFLASYIAIAIIIVVLWIQFTLISFFFFLAISCLHFGFSDTEVKPGLLYYLEGLARGLLPIAVPAYLYPELFEQLVRNSLTLSDAQLLTGVVQFFFYPCVVLLFGLIINGIVKKDTNDFLNSLELASLLILFTSLKPFAAFLVYFCFLHSLRHILGVLNEMGRSLNLNSLKWLMVQALPATLATFGLLVVSYWYWKRDLVDIGCMVNIFFISLAALTFPHMLLVEGVRVKGVLKKKK